jgi:hypothetical protein
MYHVKQSYKGVFAGKEPVMKKVLVRFDMTQGIYDKLKALAKRRYGEDSYEARNKVVEDACNWLLGRWDRDQFTFYDWFWSRMAFLCPFKTLKAIAHTKLILSRYFE